MCRWRALKGSERISLPLVPLFTPDPPLVPVKRGGRSVRRNAALSSKAYRHSSPPLHRAKRRISVSLRFPPPRFVVLHPDDPSARKMDGRGKIRWRSSRDAKRRSRHRPRLSAATPINSVAPAKFEFFLL